MKVAIAGAGAVGRSIARELVETHDVTLLERTPERLRVTPRGMLLLDGILAEIVA